MIFYDLEFTNINGERVKFETYRNKVCLIVNIASHCRFTPQMKDCQILYERYKNMGLEILAFPSNDFGEQEPLTNDEINEFCLLNFSSTFTIFQKSHVKGKKANPVFQYLSDRSLNGSFSSKPWWNFQKYLVGRDGRPTTYFYTFTKPLSGRLTKSIEKLLLK
jgi:glutathione peroxidase